jgi:class 3 adenylate cyclase/tetratricopeptide (TPR) repeat protein
VKTCPSCGRENADDARFCSQCATPLDAEASVREERKVVTCLFCDLVGFTARAESMDPEDVRRLLQPYHAQVRGELERFGGTVEKFIGDAVMAVFGAPVAHEDDPERAVRAALSIRDQLVDEGELEVRIGITTGEALIALGASPSAGEGMASGDVVNTAARLQTAAPTNGILVDETTYRATERAIEYAEARAIDAKGKAAPVSVWTATRARARVAVERVGGAALVGRKQELTLLRETLSRVIRERQPQLVTLVGVPGIGKSRLVYELFQTIETGEHGLVYWRHGRSLPYGDGITFWALGEMVKAQAGILESDSAEAAGDKLRHAVARFVPEAGDAAWIERHLRPLTGLEEEGAGDRREESFAAWRRFVEAIADDRPLVLVFEDLHWADDALLDFVDYLVDWASGVPLLALGTARPELLARRAGWGGGKVNSSTLLLSPLSEVDTTTLVHELLGRTVLDADLQSRLLEHAGGNPLYAEEFTRMHNERPNAAVLPETVQGIIAARLDTLPAEEKDLLQDAAVIGRTFWLGALGRERWTIEERLHSLGRREFVTRQRRSTVAGEDEYAFRHALVRDVAYEQIPRVERVDKHRAAAEWMESLGRPDDHAEMVAHHYGAALEYASAAGAETAAFSERARDALWRAGDRSFALHGVEQAALFYQRSLELYAEPPPSLLLQLGRTYAISGDERGVSALQEAASGLLRDGQREPAAEAYAFLSEALHLRGRGVEAHEHIATALQLVRGAPPSVSKARVLTESSRLLVLQERDDARAVAEEAYELAQTLGEAELAARALGNRGMARSRDLDFEGGLADLQRSSELARSVGSREEVRAVHNLGSTTWWKGDIRLARDHFGEAARLGKRFGVGQMGSASTAVYCSTLFHTGDWNEALALADALIEEMEGGRANYFEYHPRSVRARIRLARGLDERLVLEDISRAVEVARSTADTQALVPSLSTLVFVTAELSRWDEATAAGRDLVEALRGGPPMNVHRTIDATWVAERAGCREQLRRVVADTPADLPWRAVVLAVLDREYVRAADRLAAMGHADESYARLRAAAQLLAEGRTDDGRDQVDAALAHFRRFEASRYIRECEALLSDTSEIPA